MREDNGRRQEGVRLDNGGRAERGYGAEHNGGTEGDRLRRWYMEGWWHGDGYERNSVATRQSSREWAGSGAGAEEHGNIEVESEEGR